MSSNHQIKEYLYREAKALAESEPALGFTLAGNCTTISHTVLPLARELISEEVRLVVGSIKIEGQQFFNFTEADLQQWKSGNKPNLANLHCWLAIGGGVLDLTLSATADYKKFEGFSRGITYIDHERARPLQLEYIERLSGDGILNDLVERKA